jgi:hypothetical protein
VSFGFYPTSILTARPDFYVGKRDARHHVRLAGLVEVDGRDRLRSKQKRDLFERYNSGLIVTWILNHHDLVARSLPMLT